MTKAKETKATKATKANDDMKVIKIALFASLGINLLMFVSILSFWVLVSSAGTSRYNQATLNTILTYTDKQFCTGNGYQKIMNEIEQSGMSPQDIAKSKRQFNSAICHQ